MQNTVGTSEPALDRQQLRGLPPAAVRAAIRAGQWREHTAGLCDGYVQTNLVILPAELADDFRLFCARNPQPCPLVDVTAPGSPVPQVAAPDADLRTDLPRYRVYAHGEVVDEPHSIEHLWSDGMVGFLLGCSFTFEHALVQAGVELRHLTQGCNVAMYRTTRQCVSAGPFAGPLVVSMRPIPAAAVEHVSAITRQYPQAHGAPVWAGDPAALGIADLTRPDFGDPVEVRAGEVPVFWACGVTPQAIAMNARPPLMITHAPGHMFITDLPITAVAG